MFKIDLNKQVEDIQIGERKFKLDTSDEKLRSYIDKYDVYSKKEKEIKEKVAELGDDVTTQKFDEVYDIVKSVLKETTDFILEDSAFDYVYGMTGSVYSCADVLAKLMGHIQSKVDVAQKAKYEKYVGETPINQGRNRNRNRNR